MKLPKLSELGTVHRCKPCFEYPGTWQVYVNGFETDTVVDNPNDPLSAKDIAYSLAKGKGDDCRVSVCWEASENDPRVGMVWFTGFYQDSIWGKEPLFDVDQFVNMEGED